MKKSNKLTSAIEYYKKAAKDIMLILPIVVLALKNKQTPIIAKAMAFLVIGYACSPIDLIPDFIPILGLLDDIILLPLLIKLTIKLIPNNIIEQTKKELETNESMINNKLEKKWYYAIGIVIIYVIVILIIVKYILKII
ncbi:MAG: YkvA family protein [Erysipelotrichaceae bacterium]